jgi:acylglycerol lipase
MVPVEDSRALVAQLPRATLRTFAGDLHDVLNEHDRDAVHDVVAEFVLAQVRPAAVST